MMNLKLWQIDAFSSKPFGGNPAAVVPLESWLPDHLMQAIAAENNLAETAFFVRAADEQYDLRWFAPALEVDLCGHATLASAWVLFTFIQPSLEKARFKTRAGELIVERGHGGNTISLPSGQAEPFNAPGDYAPALARALNASQPTEFHIAEKGGAGALSLIAVWDKPDQITAINPQGNLIELLDQISCRSLIVTAKGDGKPYDMVSRFFAPHYGVPEDPVTGSAHATLTPFWSKRLGKKILQARQASPRGGDLSCTDVGERTILQGDCALYMTAEIRI
jgi:PhzF family phenazine biosynthesis protein